MVRLMIFNVLAGNKDDHSKNFSFLMAPDGRWKMAPAYDLTPSDGFSGEHSSMVNGKGKDITEADLIAAAATGSVPPKTVREIIADTQRALNRLPEVMENAKSTCRQLPEERYSFGPG